MSKRRLSFWSTIEGLELLFYVAFGTVLLGSLVYWTGFHLSQLASRIPMALFVLVIAATILQTVRDVRSRRISLPSLILVAVWGLCVLIALVGLGF